MGRFNRPASEASVAVLGAGIAGLAAAEALRPSVGRVTVFDKGRGAGGRTSVRRAGAFAFDHGAQYFTARDPRFVRQVQDWASAGIVAPWRGRFASLAGGAARPLARTDERYVGVPGMNAMARALAGDLDVRTATRVSGIDHLAGVWLLHDDEGRHLGAFDGLIVTLPAEQAVALLGERPVAERARTVAMRPCWAVLLGLEDGYEVPFDGAFVDGSPLSWVARDSSKPGRPEGEAWVLHATPEWSEAHLDAPPEAVTRELSEALERATGRALPPVVLSQTHRWGYAQADPPLDDGVLHDPDEALVLAGDWCHGSRVEGAWLSGVTAARVLLGEADEPRARNAG